MKTVYKFNVNSDKYLLPEIDEGETEVNNHGKHKILIPQGGGCLICSNFSPPDLFINKGKQNVYYFSLWRLTRFSKKKF